MIAYIHIHNEGRYMHSMVQTPILIEGTPSVGSTFYLGGKAEDSLADKIESFRQAHAGTRLYENTYIEDCVWVWDTAWREDGDGVYRLHIELYDENPARHKEK